MDLFHLLLILVIISLITYWFLTKNYDYWKKQKIPYLPDPTPGFGHILSVMSLRSSPASFIEKVYSKTNASMIGFYFIQQPSLVVRDPQLVKSVLVTNFNSFRNNGVRLDERTDPVLARNPFFATDPHLWKVTRARTTSHLTDKKLKRLFAIIQEVCTRMSAFTDRKIKENGSVYECELKDFFLRCTGEVVANSAFAIEGQSFEDYPDRLSFSVVAKSLFEPTFANGIKQILRFYLPYIADFFSMGFLPKSTDNYFRENMKKILKVRKQLNVAPDDYLQFCIESNEEGDIDSIIADVIIFYGDVYETSSTTLQMLFYQLSKNMDAQEKLRDHILSTINTTDGIITYEAVKNMTYLEQVMYEAMRLIPPVGMQMKVCTEAIPLKGSDGLTCDLQPGNYVFIPTNGLHHDSQYWPNPEVFDPDRFSPENVSNRNQYVFLPFGEGPRMCIGKRLGIMLVKLVTASTLTKYSVEFSPKTKMPLEAEPVSFLTYIKGGLWAKFRKLDPSS